MFEAAFHAAVIGKAIVAVTGHIVEANASLSAMLGRAPDGLQGVHFADFTHPHDIEADLHLFNEVMVGARDSYQLEKRYLRYDGTTLHALLSATVVREEDGTPIQFITEIIDLSESRRIGLALEEANARLRQQVITDHLTGVCNRRGFEEALVAAHQGGMASLLLIDLDDFKAVNDRLGHEAGDLVLAEVGRRLLGLVSSSDCVARVGGDEFSIILAAAGAERAQETAARVVGHLGAVFDVGSALVHIGASVGAACSDATCTTPRALKVKADTALYAAKRAGRGAWRLAE